MRRALSLAASWILASALLVACPEPSGPAGPAGPPPAPPAGKGAPPPAPPAGKGAGRATPGTPEAPEPPAVIAVRAIGVPACDALLKMWACAALATPEVSRPAVIRSYNQTVIAWQRMLADPNTRATLATACASATPNMRSTWGANPSTKHCVP